MAKVAVEFFHRAKQSKDLTYLTIPERKRMDAFRRASFRASLGPRSVIENPLVTRFGVCHRDQSSRSTISSTGVLRTFMPSPGGASPYNGRRSNLLNRGAHARTTRNERRIGTVGNAATHLRWTIPSFFPPQFISFF